jgi:hypothetical protein
MTRCGVEQGRNLIVDARLRGRRRDLPRPTGIERVGAILSGKPFAQTWIFDQAVRYQICAVFMIAAFEDAAALFLGQRFELAEQGPAQGRRAIRDQVHEHGTAGGDFARFKRARAFVAFQIEKLKTF